MPRTSKAHNAGLDLLDLISFNDLVVHHGMDDDERQQLDKIIFRVTEMVDRVHVGREAEIAKHLAFAILGIALSNTSAECRNAFPWVPSSSNLPEEMVEKISQHLRDFEIANVLAFTAKTFGFDVSPVWEIIVSLQNEFSELSALVRRDLLLRCFVAEFEEAALKSYCWLTVSEVLPVTKNDPSRIRCDLDEKFLLRLALLCSYEMITHYLNVFSRESSSVEVMRLNHKSLDLKEPTIDRLLHIDNVFQGAWSRSSLRNTVPQIRAEDMTDKQRVVKFFDNWGARKVRFRMHAGTLASWLSFLGAIKVERHHAFESKKQDRENKRATEAGERAQRVMRPVFSATDNDGAITDVVQIRLFEHYGLHINADTLYRCHSMLRKSTLKLVELHCRTVRKAGVAYSAVHDDPFYLSQFVHSEKYH